MGIKRELIICFIALFPMSGFAQFDAQRTQYMYSPTAVNPGALASNDMLNVYISVSISSNSSSPRSSQHFYEVTDSVRTDSKTSTESGPCDTWLTLSLPY